MRQSGRFALALVLACASSAFGQAPQANAPQTSSAEGTDVYLVHVVQAAAGKALDLEKVMTTPPAGQPQPRALMLRHTEGAPWDFVYIEHMGPRATIEPGPVSAEREWRAWHEDTYVVGPPWAEFSKAMGTEGGANNVYVVSTYRGLPGHRADLEQTLKKIQASDAKPGSAVTMRHLDGASWDYIVISRYDSWQALAADQTDTTARQREQKAGLTKPAGLELRDHVAWHTDTIAVRAGTPR